MTLKKITLAAIAIILMFSCSPAKDEIAETTLDKIETSKQAEIAKDLTEEKMDLWFLAFNYYQSKGYDMETADKMANEAVAKQVEPKSLETLAINPETDLN